MADTGATLAELYAAGRILESNRCMCRLVQANADVPQELSAHVRTQFRIVDELVPGADEGKTETSKFMSHPVVSTSHLDVYENMTLCFAQKVENTIARVSFQTEYEWTDLCDVLWACSALPLVFADDLLDAIVLSDETPNTRVLLLKLAGTIATSLRAVQAIVRVTRVNSTQRHTHGACPVLILHDASQESGYSRYLDRTKYDACRGFSACVFCYAGINEHTVSLCMRWTPAQSWVSTICAVPLGIMARVRLVRAVQAWLAAACKVYHGDRTVSAITNFVHLSKLDDPGIVHP
jgi:hypothetical protein